MSSRVRSEFGTLGQRVRATGRRALPCHVWVDGDAAVLCAWDQRADDWWGRCLHVVDGEGAESWVRADRIRPVN